MRFSEAIYNTGAQFVEAELKKNPNRNLYIINLAPLLHKLGFHKSSIRDYALYLLQRGAIDKAREMGFLPEPVTAVEMKLISRGR